MKALPETEPNNLGLLLAKRIEMQGPLSVSEYMQAANEHYYNSRDPLGQDGDFITAPEVSQMFGELIALWFTDIWQRKGSPESIALVELGPGRGTLANDCLRVMERFGFTPKLYLLETSDALRAKQAVLLPNAEFCSSVDELPEDTPLFILANEFFDALPVRQYVSTHSGWRERVVAREKGSKFVAMPGTLDADQIIPNDLRAAPQNSVYENSPATSDVMYGLANRLNAQGGAMLIIDYGYTHPGLGSTLQAVKAHKYTDPFDNPGECDLTAHVNFLEVANLARMRDLRIAGPVEQGQFLSLLGINQRAETLSKKHPDRAEDIIAARNRLANADEMGSLFKVMGIAHPEWPTPEGFESQIS